MAKEKSAQGSTNGEFKMSPWGFDKNEVMVYIARQSKEKKALQEEIEQLKAELAVLKEQPTTENLQVEVEKKKKELDEQILESRKQVLDERRKLAQTEKELHVLQDKFKSLAEEFDAHKKQAAKKLKNARSTGGSLDPAYIAEVSEKASKDANAVIADAQEKAQQIIDKAGKYYHDAVSKADSYKRQLLANSNAAGAVVRGGVDVAALLASLAQQLNDAVNSVLQSAGAEPSPVEVTDDVPDEARDELKAITAEPLPDASVMQVEPYSFELKVAAPAAAPADNDNLDDLDDDDDLMTDHDGLLSSFSVISSDIQSDNDDMTGGFSEEDVVIDNVAEPANASDDFTDLLTEAPKPAPAPAAKVDDDLADMFTEAPKAAPEPAPAPAAKVDDDLADMFTEAPKAAPEPAPAPAKADDDFSDLLAEAPKAAPAPAAKADDDFSDLLAEAPKAAPAPAKADDDFSDLLAEAPKSTSDKADDDFSDLLAEPVAQKERSLDRSSFGSIKEHLNESRNMGVAGKEPVENDPWKELEAQMNGMSITAPPKKEPAQDDMAASFDDIEDDAPAGSDDKIDMSDYNSMLGGNGNDTKVNANSAQYDPSWDFKIMEGMAGADDDDDDEMSSDSGGFFDL